MGSEIRKPDENNIAETFAEFFEFKVNSLVNQATVCPQVYNGSPKIEVDDVNFMPMENVLRSMKEIKLKNSEGWDRIPQRIIIKPLVSNFTVNET